MALQHAEPISRTGLQLIASQDSARAMSRSWQELALDPLVPSAASLPEWIIPQLGRDGLLALAIHGADGLQGMFPLRRQSRRWALSWPVLASWATPLTFSGLPLLARARGRAALTTLLRDMDAAALILDRIPAEGPFWDALAAAASETGAPMHVCESWQRAALKPAGSFESWFEGNFERKRRKEYRRLRARLSGVGRLENLAWRGGELQPWIDELVALEAAGWKGRRGTALASNPAVAACLGEALHGLALERRLRFWKIVLDGKVIAALFGLVHGGQAWLGKIAYDEAFARYSPGALLILHATEQLLSEPRIRMIDSCAIPDHPLIDNMWRDRLGMADVMICKPGTSQAKAQAMIGAETLRRGARATAKQAWLSFAKGRQS